MKKTVSIFSFIVSALLFLYFLVITVGFIVTIINYPLLENSGDILNAMVIIYIYAGTFLIVSILGLIFAVLSARLFDNKIVRTCSNIEIVFFSIGLVFSTFQLFIK